MKVSAMLGRLRHPQKVSAMLDRLRHPQTTVRWRLTLLYGALFLVSGAALLVITYTLVEHANVSGPVRREFIRAGASVPSPNFLAHQVRTLRGAGARQLPVNTTAVPPVLKRLLKSPAGRAAVTFVGLDQRGADLHQLVIESAIALAIMAVISGALGWVVAGRVLAPLRTMTEATREISAVNLYERLALAGPRDELRELADTIDGLLSRLQGAFDAQRRFVANASHELRTPLTAARAMLELVLTDPHATINTFRMACRQVLEESEHQEELIDALLTLAQGQRGLERREPVELAALVREVVERHRAEALARGLQFEATLEPATVSGDPRLLERLVSNLVQNAVAHNRVDGEVQVLVRAQRGAALLTVSNTGAVVPPDDVERLLQPFERLGTDRVGRGTGLGLGLSIVAAIAAAHDAGLELRPRTGGGLDVTVRVPVAAGTGGEPSAQPEPVLSAD